MRTMPTLRRAVRALGAAALALAATAAPARAQWITLHENAYMPAAHNWVFRDRFPEADRLFNAFDYGHAILSERLLTAHGNPAALEEDAFGYLTGTLLAQPPRLPLVESAIAPRASRLAPEILAMFDWAHLLHRHVYDVLADPRIPDAARDTAIATLVRWYKTRPDLAFSSRPKSMALMQEQPYSLAFRKAHPRFNGLIWAYHWLQMGLYEPLTITTDTARQRAGIAEALARFRRQLLAPPDSFPVVMPMTPAIAPAFTKRWPELGIIFDNLHSLHDVVSDILANDAIPRDGKRAALLHAAATYRDDTTEVITPAAWLRMAEVMGIENMGGPVMGPRGRGPTVARGVVMRHDANGNMIGDEHGMHHAMPAAGAPAAADTAHAGHAMPMADTARKADTTHAGHAMPMPAAAAAPAADPHAAHHAMAAPAGDSALRALNARGAGVMGVDQWTSQHVFQDLTNGGRIILERDPADAAGVRAIRAHLREVAADFARGDFSKPFATHGTGDIPGTAVLAARRAKVRYAMRPRPGGGEVRITTTDPAALKALRAFLKYQRDEHHAPATPGGHEHKMP
jgi:hypothetical protein